jgi:hypothetical protein
MGGLFLQAAQIGERLRDRFDLLQRRKRLSGREPIGVPNRSDV